MNGTLEKISIEGREYDVLETRSVDRLEETHPNAASLAISNCVTHHLRVKRHAGKKEYVAYRFERLIAGKLMSWHEIRGAW